MTKTSKDRHEKRKHDTTQSPEKQDTTEAGAGDQNQELNDIEMNHTPTLTNTD